MTEYADVQKQRLNKFLEFLVTNGGSDLHVKAGSHIRGRIHGEIVKLSDSILSKEDALDLAKELLRGRFDELIREKSVDFTYKLNDRYRFRTNVFFQIDGISIVLRTITVDIPTMEQLKLPPTIKKICDETERGIILLTGPTGSGKTTTIASMIDYINERRTSHIVTIEDPVEFVFRDKNCIINQRSLGQDCNTFADSLRAALREDPDIIFVGEMRDLITIETAMNAAETGHLVLSTLHTVDAKETLGRIIGMFEVNEQNRIRQTLAAVLEAVISQRLVKTTDGKRTAAVEILRKNTRIRDMILDHRDGEIVDAIKEGRRTYGMQTFDQHLLELYQNGVITRDEALIKSTTRGDLEIMIKNEILARQGADSLNEDVIELKEI
ncbi:MAG: type IV pilus twitching motility protein PilT [Campylobacter sp.]|jgi:twitching motility protein